MTLLDEREDHQARRYHLGQPDRRGLLGRREPGEVVLLVGCTAAGVVISLASGGSIAGFLILAGLLLTALTAVWVPWRGRTAYRWVPVDLAFARQRRAGAAEYTNPGRELGTQFTTGQAVPVDAPPAVGRLRWLSAPCAGAELGVLVQSDEGSLVSVLEIEGPGVGLFDGPDQEAAVGRWGTVLRDLANSDGLVRRVALVERCVPTDPFAHLRYLAERGDRAAPRDLVASYDELTERVGAVSEEHRNFLVVQVPADRDLARAAKQAGGGDAGLAAVVAREVEALAGRLEDAGIKVLHGLGPQRLTALIASATDPLRAIDDHERLTVGEAWPRWSRNDEGAWVTSRRVSDDQPDWHHATAWIKSWPMVPVGVNFMAPLLVQTPGVVRTVAVSMDLVATDRAMTAAMSDLTTDEASAAAALRAGRTTDPRDGKQRSQAERRAEDLANGAAGVRLVGYVTVSGRNAEDLESSKRRLRAAAARCWLSLEWCDKEHDRAFVNTLPLARGIR